MKRLKGEPVPSVPPYPASDQQLSDQTDDAVYFFTHAFDPLNPWSAHQVKLWGKTFPTAEHAYHYRKFSDHLPKVAAKILESPSPWAAMQIVRRYKSKRRTDWEDIKVSIMEEILRAMAEQNEDVRLTLQNTGQKTIIKNSPDDDFWGIGAQGNGQNKIGKILMKIREKLRKEHKQ